MNWLLVLMQLLAHIQGLDTAEVGDEETATLKRCKGNGKSRWDVTLTVKRVA